MTMLRLSSEGGLTCDNVHFELCCPLLPSFGTTLFVSAIDFEIITSKKLLSKFSSQPK